MFRLLGFSKMFYIVMYTLMCKLRNELERKGCGLIVVCVYLVDKGLVVLASYVNMTEDRVIREEGSSTEKIYP